MTISDDQMALLWSYLLDELSAEERAEVESKLASDANLRAEFDGLCELADVLPLAEPKLRAPASVRSKLLASVAKAHRYAPFFPSFARVFDLAQSAVENVFARATDRGEWEAGPFPGSSLFHFAGGPAMAGADCGLAEFAANFVHPYHKHLGRETVLVLSGQFTDSNGDVVGPGDIVTSDKDSAHHYVVGDAPLIIAVALEVGIEVFPQGPDGPSIVVSAESD